MIATFEEPKIYNPFGHTKKTPPSYHNGRVAKVKRRRAKNRAARKARKIERRHRN
jgi:hypothetical protein